MLPATPEIDATIELLIENNAFFIRAHLDVSLPGVDREVARDLVDAAHGICPYSKATRGNIEVESEVGKGTTFQRVIPETATLAKDDKIRRVVITSGKVYYDLFEARAENKIDESSRKRGESIAVIRYGISSTMTMQK